MSCSIILNNILYVFKNISNLIFILSPILGIISLAILLVKMASNPDDKKGLKKIKNILMAIVIIFFIPTIVTALLYIIGEDNEAVACYFNSSEIITNGEAKYIQIEDKEKKSLIEDPSNYEKGVPKTMNFSCKSNTVKANFSCETLSIVEKHMNDINAQNFNNVINQYGGFDNYAKNVGGIFGEYYGKKIEGRTEKDFQMASEYVIGWMYMYGWDYMNGGGRHVKWGGGNYTADAFYANGGFQGKYVSDSNTGRGGGTNFDNIISGKNGGTGRMASECGDLEIFVYNKLNIARTKQLPKPTALKDLKVGDCIYFFDHRVDKNSEKSWGMGKHNAVVGEVYNDKIVIYDAGSYLQYNRDYKRTVLIPSNYSEEADYAAIKKEFGYDGWGIRRWYEFQK